MNDLSNSTEARDITLRQLFDDNIRAEWSTQYFEDLFVPPTYLTKLESVRPCFLFGGRGTGKTTALRSLGYDSVAKRLDIEGSTFSDQEFLGILVRMNKNQVRGFCGEELDDSSWRKLFAHFFNLKVSLEFTKLAEWLESNGYVQLGGSSMKLVAKALGLADATNVSALSSAIKEAIVELELYVNNPLNSQPVTLSMAETPLRLIADELAKTETLSGKVFFCCIDEYENLLDYQQAVINTYIKHAEPPLTYKVGVRTNGLRNRQTLDGGDLLKTPDDFAEIEIAEEGFNYFAKAVAEKRLQYANKGRTLVPDKLEEFLPDLSLEDEAILLGAEKIAQEVVAELLDTDFVLAEKIQVKNKADICFLRYWQEASGLSLPALASDWLDNEPTWSTRIDNHRYASLFWITKGKKGARIRKYYCGARTFLSLPAGNIRYFLELLDAAIKFELDAGTNDQKQGLLAPSPKSQTLAAASVGKRQLNQLEGLADHGVQLKRLVLAIGKVFFEFARTPQGRSPEVASFVIEGTPQEVSRIRTLMDEGVAHLAFEVAPRTKATTNLEIKDDEFRLHSIFCAFFEITHRKKRRTTFNARNLLAVLDDKPSKAISMLMGGGQQSDEDDLPEQLAFFTTFYD